jgi:hypothetical protein
MDRLEFIEQMLYLLVEGVTLPDADKDVYVKDYAKNISLVFDKEIKEIRDGKQ